MTYLNKPPSRFSRVPGAFPPSRDLDATPPVSAAGETVVLVHGSASSAQQWRPLTKRLDDSCRTLTVELRGHGGREGWSGDGPLTLAAEASAIADITRGVERFHLVGHSYGGAVALRYALDHPGRLASLALVEPSCFHVLKDAGDDARLLIEIQAVAHAVNRNVISGDYRKAMAVFIDYWAGVGTWASLPRERRDRLAGRALHVAHHFWSLIEEPTPLSAYAALDVPTLILCGNRSPQPSRAVTGLLAEVMPNAKRWTVANGHHMTIVTRPELVNPFILSHVRNYGAARGSQVPRERSRRAA